MNKTMLSTALLAILATTSYAENTAQPSTTPAPGTNSAPTTTPAPAATAQPAQPATAPVDKTSTIPAPQTPATPPVIDCKYHIAADNNNIEQSVISTWAGKATVQSFEFNPTTIDNELTALKSCYTDAGWQGFNDALQKSGNIEAIKTQHLTVSSQVDGDIKVNPVKDNQWKVNVPVQVVYQNDKEKLTQLLEVDLLIGRKISGDLGIMQMIATPRQAGGAPAAEGQTQPATTPAPTTTAPAPAAQPTQPSTGSTH